MTRFLVWPLAFVGDLGRRIAVAGPKSYFVLVLVAVVLGACSGSPAAKEPVQAGHEAVGSQAGAVGRSAVVEDRGARTVDWAARVRDWPDGYTRPDSFGYPFRGVEHIRYVVACLRDLGFEVLETTNRTDYLVNRGNLSIAEITEVQSGCEQRAVSIGLVDPRPESPEEEYALLVEVHQCLIEAGFPVPELVTLDAYVDGDDFDPYEAVGGITSVPVGVAVPGDIADSDSVRAAEECPYGG